MKKIKKSAPESKITSIVVPPDLNTVINNDVKEQKKTRNVNFSSVVCQILYQHYKDAGKLK
jgi:hypothetical protein